LTSNFIRQMRACHCFNHLQIKPSCLWDKSTSLSWSSCHLSSLYAIIMDLKLIYIDNKTLDVYRVIISKTWCNTLSSCVQITLNLTCYNKYSQTCAQRSSLGPKICGRCWQVVVVDRWSLLTVGRCSKVVLWKKNRKWDTGFTKKYASKL
jgi:hypothetical protein